MTVSFSTAKRVGMAFLKLLGSDQHVEAAPVEHYHALAVLQNALKICSQNPTDIQYQSAIEML